MPDQDEFVRATEQFRRELLAHCYRMLGSVDDAEELVQETYLRAWRSYSDFEHRASVRHWLYRIATNACLTALQRPARRALPSGLGAPSQDPDAPPALAGPEVRWLQPIPDALVNPVPNDPAAIVSASITLRLALIASLQHLPGRQRAVLILRDALAFPAAEVAQMLDVSTPAVKSALQRARARLEQVAPTIEQLTEPNEPEARALLDQYMNAFEQADPAALEQALRKDAILEMTPSRTWYAGKRICMGYLEPFLGSADRWRMLATRANGQPAAAAYHRTEDGQYTAFAIVVLATTTDGIARITLFGDTDLFERFDLPPTYPSHDPPVPRTPEH
jgi:RNA polymerase sigma-70 factor (ECF subfamily)